MDVDICYTDDPDGLEQCLTDCKAYLPENETKHYECINNCYLKYCVEDPNELTDELEEAIG